jgi:uncharacterized protein
MDMYDLTVPQLKHTLANLRRWLERAAKHEMGEAMLSARLAPDQFALVKQVQTATDNAKFIAARLAGKEWPSHPDTETTYEQLYARIASVVEFLGTFSREDFVGAGERKIKLPWMAPTQFLTGADYALQFAMPNYYFHLVTAYGIMRHSGVQLGKMDYIGPINIKSE